MLVKVLVLYVPTPPPLIQLQINLQLHLTGGVLSRRLVSYTLKYNFVCVRTNLIFHTFH